MNHKQLASRLCDNGHEPYRLDWRGEAWVFYCDGHCGLFVRGTDGAPHSASAAQKLADMAPPATDPDGDYRLDWIAVHRAQVEHWLALPKRSIRCAQGADPGRIGTALDTLGNRRPLRIDRNLFRRVWDCVPWSGERTVKLWRGRYCAPVYLDGIAWRMVIMPLAGEGDRDESELFSLAEDAA